VLYVLSQQRRILVCVAELLQPEDREKICKRYPSQSHVFES
jgi:hypothetical protein